MRLLALSAALSFALATPAYADYGDCGQPRSGGSDTTIEDVLHVIYATSQGRECPLEMCDTDGDCQVTLRDALQILRQIIGHDVDLQCDAECGGTGEPDECRDDDDCRDGHECDDGRCEKDDDDDDGDECRYDHDCERGYECDDGRCEKDDDDDDRECRENDDCRWGQKCVDGECKYGDRPRSCGYSEAPVCGGACPENYSCSEIERGDRVKICHKPWWKHGEGKTIEVSEHAVRAHLWHGDYVGECGSCKDEKECKELSKDWKKKKKKKDKKREKRKKKHDKKYGADHVHGEHHKHDKKHRDWKGFGCRCVKDTDTTTTTMRPTTTTTMRPTTTTTTDRPTTTTTAAPTTTTTTAPTTTTTLPPPVGDADNDGLPDKADPCLDDPRNLCVGTVAMDETTGNEIRLNANVSGAPCSGTKIDCAGDTWFADFGYNQADFAFACLEANGCPIEGVTELFGCTSETTQDLFRCEHWDVPDAPELIYSFDVPNGLYVVNTFWANIFPGTAEIGDRLVDIIVEGQTVYASFDQMQAAGEISQKAVVRSAVVSVADGNGLQIEFGHVEENPGIKAIEVLKVN